MNYRQRILLVALCIGFVTVTFGQHRRYDIQNGLGIGGGLTQYNILTDNFETKQGNGWLGGMTATVDLPHRWYTVSYMLQLSESNLGISASSLLSPSSTEMVDYKIMTAQVAFMFHAKVIKSNFMIDAGPMLQYNGKLDLKDKNKGDYVITGYNTLTANEISDISKFNVNAAVGATAGFDHFKLRVQYIYGITNMLNKLNDQNLDASPSNKAFKGNQSMLAFMAFIYF
ncbi:MAG: hypothetical protein KDD03_04960 [Gelidibacter sp.]|nr:hypothetical protein [Gelidibacter sp.]